MNVWKDLKSSHQGEHIYPGTELQFHLEWQNEFSQEALAGDEKKNTRAYM